LAGQQLLRIGHGPWRRRWERRRHLAGQAGGVVGEEAAPAYDLGGDGIQARRELRQRNGLAPPKAREQAQVRAGEQAEVLTVLAVDALEALGEYQAEAGAQLRIGAGLPAAALAPALPRHAHRKAPSADRPRLHGEGPAALKTKVGEVPQCLVEVVADVGRGDLVRADLVPERRGRFKLQVLAFELAEDPCRILR